MSSNNHVLDIFLAEELARAYETALQANLREQDLSNQVNGMREHIARMDDQLLERDQQLIETTARHNRLAITNERLRRRVTDLEEALTSLRHSLARYRAENVNTAFRTIPASFQPTLRRVRSELAEQRRIRQRLDFANVVSDSD